MVKAVDQSPIAEYRETEAGLAALRKDYEGVVYAVSTKEGMATARKARAHVKGVRVSVEKLRVDLKEDLIKRGRVIDGEAKRITTILTGLEDPIDRQIKVEEERAELERTREAREAAAKVAAEEALIKAGQEEKLKAEQAQLERERAAFEKAKAERVAQLQAEEAERRAKIEAEDRERRARQEAEERHSREAIQKEQDAAREREEAARKLRQAEEDKLAVERDRIAAERRALEDEAAKKAREHAAKLEAEAEEKRRREREAREKKEAEEREQKRAAQLRLDARSMLASFVAEYGQTKEFKPIADKISAFLKETRW